MFDFLIGNGVEIGSDVLNEDSPLTESGDEGGEVGVGKVNLSAPLGTCILRNAQDNGGLLQA
jgi:hypothetical protein